MASDFLVRVIFLAVPGIVSYMLFRKLVGKTKCEKWEEWCKVVLFSLIIYGSYSLLVWLFAFFGWGSGELVFFKAVLEEEAPIEWSEIIIASLIGLPVAFVASAIHTHKLVNSLGRIVRVTKSFGGEDVWEHFHNLADMPEYEWVFVRDHKAGLVYFGFIRAYSEAEKERELLMCDVDVYTNDEGDFLYKTEMLYLCRDNHDLTMEIRMTNDKSQDNPEELAKEIQ